LAAVTAAGQLEEASGHLSTALAEWRGPVLDDLHDFPFVEVFATALTEDYILAQSPAQKLKSRAGVPARSSVNSKNLPPSILTASRYGRS
jgi:DNA-binding SARP family transcriptional activator